MVRAFHRNLPVALKRLEYPGRAKTARSRALIRKGAGRGREHHLGALNARKLALGVGCPVGSLWNVFGSFDRVLNTPTFSRLYAASNAAVSTSGADGEISQRKNEEIT